MKTYDQIHSGLHWARGRASEHACVKCGEPAKHWAYMYTAGEDELTAPDGGQYSENFDDYSPMCISCHRNFDYENSEAVREAYRKRGALGGLALEQRRQADPELAERLRKIRSENGKVGGAKSGAMVRTCAECGLSSNPPGLGRHQKFSGHRGTK